MFPDRIGAWNLFLGFLLVFSFNAVFLISFPTLRLETVHEIEPLN